MAHIYFLNKGACHRFVTNITGRALRALHGCFFPARHIRLTPIKHLFYAVISTDLLRDIY